MEANAEPLLPAPYLISEKLLVDLSMVNLLLYCAAGDEPVNRHLLLLPNSPRPFPGLHVCGGIPIRVKDQNPADVHAIKLDFGSGGSGIINTWNEFNMLII